MWLHKTGSAPKAFEDYNENVIAALLHCWPAAQREMMMILHKARKLEWETAKAAGIEHDHWTKPRYTGDAVADAWEEAIARGEMPDLDGD
jgi:hypothetical protein